MKHDGEKTDSIPLDRKTYDPSRLLNVFKDKLQLTDDAMLCHKLGVSPLVIQNIRAHTLPVGAWLLMRMSEVSNLDVKELRILLGDRRKKIRMAIARSVSQLDTPCADLRAA